MSKPAAVVIISKLNYHWLEGVSSTPERLDCNFPQAHTDEVWHHFLHPCQRNTGELLQTSAAMLSVNHVDKVHLEIQNLVNGSMDQHFPESLPALPH